MQISRNHLIKRTEARESKVDRGNKPVLIVSYFTYSECVIFLEKEDNTRLDFREAIK